MRMGLMLSGIALVATFGGAASVQAQALPQKAQTVQPTVPGTRFNPPAGAVVDDPNRIFGDEAPVFAPLAIVGALGLTPSASLNITYDDNFARLQGGEPLPTRFVSKSEWSFRPNFGLGAERNVGRHRVFLNAGVGRIIYARNTQFNSNRFNVGGGVGLYLGRMCGGQIAAGYSKRDWLVGGFEEAANATAESTTFSSSLNCSTSSGLSGNISYGRGQQQNVSRDGEADRSFANSKFQSLGGSIGYRVGLRGQVGVNVGWSENRFPNQLILGEENRNTITNYSLFAAYRIGSTLNASGSIGKSSVRSNTPGSQTFEGGVWNLGVAYAGPRFGANLSVGQSVNGGGGNQSANFAISRNFTGSVTYRVANGLNLSAGYNHFDQDFKGTLLVPETRQVQNFSGDRLFAGASYGLARFLTLRGDISHQQRRSQPDGAGFKSNQATLGIVARF
jgi:hypothetical protein